MDDLSKNNDIFLITGIRIDKINDRVNVIIPPAYKWKKKDSLFYYLLFSYSIIFLSNLVFSLSNGIYGYFNLSCFVMSSLFDRDFKGIVLNTQLIFIPSIFLGFENTNNIITIAVLLIIVENLLLGDLRNSFFRELIGTTYIEINPCKLSIYRKCLFLWQMDFESQINQKETISKMKDFMRIDSFSILSRLNTLSSVSNQTSKKYSKYILLKNRIYFLGFWLNQREKALLVNSIEEYLVV